jgi:RHS repeat-associated protein
VSNYAIDIASGLTQVLADDEHTYLYGVGRMAQYGATGAEYFLGDALGSVRQLADADGQVSLAQSYKPYGETLSSSGEGATSYGFTGEWVDESGLVFLRSRYYSPAQGRFLSRDVWEGDEEMPLSLNRWNYVEGNPINFVDLNGYFPYTDENAANQIRGRLSSTYHVEIPQDYGWGLDNSMGYGQCGKVWYGGAWETIRELELVEEAIDKTAQEMGNPSKFIRAMQTPVKIVRLGIPVIHIPVVGPIRPFAPPQFLNSVSGDIPLPDYTFSSSENYARYSIIHELGHVWDRRTSLRLSNGLVLALDTVVCNGMGGCLFEVSRKEDPPGDPKQPYAGKNSMEDWAESFANYVYPQYYQIDMVSYGYLTLGLLRRAYVIKQIRSIP